MSFKKSNSSAGEEFAARKRPPLGPKDKIDVNDIETLRYYITDYGKILPARITGVTSQQQRQIRQGVKRARNMGLMA
ncbi:MAG: 30S ribosomal protein S18 [Kiritimatiellae bacterium]|nr:30S ribosomal protein S18 [Kiritimatiellia bacterium]